MCVYGASTRDRFFFEEQSYHDGKLVNLGFLPKEYIDPQKILLSQQLRMSLASLQICLSDAGAQKTATITVVFVVATLQPC